MEERGEGWLIFAGIALLIVGIMRIFDAIWAFRYHGVLPSNLEAAIFGHSLKTYGWVYLIVGIVMILAGIGVMVRSQFFRWMESSPQPSLVSVRSGGCPTTPSGH